MKLIVFGASGQTGQNVIQQALEQGHEVSAFVHRRPIDHEDVRSVQGDVMNAEDVSKAIAGQDAVISTLGHNMLQLKIKQPTMQTVGMRNIVDAMTAHGVKRVISLTGAGVRQPGDIVRLHDRILNKLLLTFRRPIIVDGMNHLRILEQSDVDWTVIRALILTNNQADESVELTLNGPTKTFVSRATIARQMLQLAESDEFTQQAPLISNS